VAVRNDLAQQNNLKNKEKTQRIEGSSAKSQAPSREALTPLVPSGSAPDLVKITNNQAKTHAAIMNTNEIASSISEMLSNRASSQINIAALAAGDDALNGKIWTKVFGASGVQKGLHAAKSNTFGATIGGDIDLLNNKMLLGAAFTHAKLNVKVKNEDRVHANFNMMSIYTRHDILKNAFVTSSLSYGLVDVKNLTFSGSKNKANTVKANINLVYNIQLENGALVTPKIGISYDNVKIKNLKSSPNNKGSNANMERISTDFSLSVAKNIKVREGFKLTPGVNFGINHISHQTNPLSKTEHLLPAPKAPKASYNVGVSVLATRNQAINFDIGYNFNWKSKYKAHSGFAKLEVKF
jgi:outer membrane autotransporter protein